MKNIYLIRHCATVGQHKDSPLSTEGIRQAQLLSIFLRKNEFPIDRIISSPYLRAIESIKPYSEASNIKIEIDDRLSERIISNEPVDDWLEVMEQSFVDVDYKLPGGESANEAMMRANQLLDDILQKNALSHIALITHRNLLALILSQYDNQFNFSVWKEMKLPELYHIAYENQTVTSIKKIVRH